MRRLIALLWLVVAVPASAGPQVTVLLPIFGAMSPKSISDAFRGYASVRAALPSIPISDVADSLYTSDVALLVLDATHGPLPENREHTLATRQSRVPYVIVLITNVDALYDAVSKIDCSAAIHMLYSISPPSRSPQSSVAQRVSACSLRFRCLQAI